MIVLFYSCSWFCSILPLERWRRANALTPLFFVASRWRPCCRFLTGNSKSIKICEPMSRKQSLLGWIGTERFFKVWLSLTQQECMLSSWLLWEELSFNAGKGHFPHKFAYWEALRLHKMWHKRRKSRGVFLNTGTSVHKTDMKMWLTAEPSTEHTGLYAEHRGTECYVLLHCSTVYSGS